MNLAFKDSDLYVLIISQTTQVRADAYCRLADLGKDLICGQKENLCFMCPHN